MRAVSKIAGIAIALSLLPVAFLVTTDISPYLYTKVHGDAGTQKLYQLYDAANDNVPLNEIMKFINANGIDFILHESDGIIEAYIEHSTRAEHVLIWHKSGKTIHARFEAEP
jgi:hypothetical protein